MQPLKEIPGFKGRYFAYEEGVILTSFRDELAQLKWALDKDGYPVVYFSRGGKTIKKRVHILIGELFVPGRSTQKCELDHLDGDRLDPSRHNLEWVTRQENMRRMWARRRLQSA